MPQSTKKILVPIDFSEQSLIALEQSYTLAREAPNYLLMKQHMVFAKFFQLQHEDLET